MHDIISLIGSLKTTTFPMHNYTLKLQKRMVYTHTHTQYILGQSSQVGSYIYGKYGFVMDSSIKYQRQYGGPSNYRVVNMTE